MWAGKELFPVGERRGSFASSQRSVAGLDARESSHLNSKRISARFVLSRLIVDLNMPGYNLLDFLVGCGFVVWRPLPIIPPRGNASVRLHGQR